MSAKGSSIQNVGIAEVAEILAAGLMRLRARKSSHLSAQDREISVDCAAHQSGHAEIAETEGGWS